jgi:cytoskeletal protein CcmA (bactofilin family)
MSQSSVIGAGTVVRGNLEGEGSLEVYGRVEGDVNLTGDVLVGDGGAVLGDVTAAKISVAGAVQGNLRGSDAVLLERGAKVVGDLSAPRVGIANGALVRGSVRTEGEPAPAANKRAVGPGLKPATFAAKPVAKVEPKPAVALRAEPVRPVELAVQPPRAQEKAPERRPPPPVLPSLGKGAKGKKKKDRDE